MATGSPGRPIGAASLGAYGRLAWLGVLAIATWALFAGVPVFGASSSNGVDVLVAAAPSPMDNACNNVRNSNSDLVSVQVTAAGLLVTWDPADFEPTGTVNVRACVFDAGPGADQGAISQNTANDGQELFAWSLFGYASNPCPNNNLTFGGSVDSDTVVTQKGDAVGCTASPTATPTVAPTATPTVAPTATPTATPTQVPTATPTVAPTATPTVAPTATPTVAPTATPTLAPTATPTQAPTATPTPTGTEVPATPTPTGTEVPATPTPTVAPTATPTVAPTATPTVAPTATPSESVGGATPTPTQQPGVTPPATDLADTEEGPPSSLLLLWVVFLGVAAILLGSTSRNRKATRR